MTARQKVELHNAHVWDCEECGRENFCRSVTVEMNPDDPRDAELIALAKAECEEIGGDVNSFWQSEPEVVVCSHCGAEFETGDE